MNGTFEARAFALTLTLLAAGPPADGHRRRRRDVRVPDVRFVVGPEPVSTTLVHVHGTVWPHHVTGSVRTLTTTRRHQSSHGILHLHRLTCGPV